MNADEAHKISNTGEVEFIGKIPVRNLWLLLLYASDLYQHQVSYKIKIEDNQDNIADLVAEILCAQVERRLMRNLSFGYVNTVATINRVRGRIDALYTERHRLLEKGKVNCRFDELTINTPRNRYVRAALDCLSTLASKGNLTRRCRTLTNNLERLGVKKGKPSGYSRKSERFGRHDIQDQIMITAAELAFSLALPTEFTGDHHLVMPDKNIYWLRKLFEKGIAGFFAVALDKAEWQVLAGKWYNWQIDHQTDGIDAILPSMKTDIVIDNILTIDRLIIDTKFNAITTNGYYRKDTLRSGYIYQMYAYLRSQESKTDEASLNATGMLLHPSVGIEINETVTIQGHKIKFCTVDLSVNASKIRQQLLSLIL